MDPVLDARDVRLTLDGTTVLDGVSVHVGRGEFVGLIGPNGSGKSTLLRCLTKVLAPSGGQVLLDGAPLTQCSYRQVARRMAVVAQENPAAFDFTVREVVAMSRYARKRLMQTLDGSDHDVVTRALGEVGLLELADQSFLRLSGGEKQRTLLARAFAQETELIVLDEPTNHLDIGSQLEALELVRRSGKTTVCALHDLPTAVHYCDRVYVLKDGNVVAEGPPEHTVTAELIASVYGVECEVFRRNGRVFIDFFRTGGSGP